MAATATSALNEHDTVFRTQAEKAPMSEEASRPSDPPAVPADAMAVILNSLPNFRDKVRLLSASSSWRNAAFCGVQRLSISPEQDEQGRSVPVPVSRITRLLSHFCSLTAVHLHSGSFSWFSADLLTGLARHPLLKELVIGVIPGDSLVELETRGREASRGEDGPEDGTEAESREGNTGGASEDEHALEHAREAQRHTTPEEHGAALFAAYSTLFTSCPKLEEIRLEGSLVQRQDQLLAKSKIAPRLKQVQGLSGVAVPPGGELGLPRCVPRSLQQLKKLKRLHLGPRLFAFHSLSVFSGLPLLECLTCPLDSTGSAPGLFRDLPCLKELNLLFDDPFCVPRIAIPAALQQLSSLHTLGLFCAMASLSGCDASFGAQYFSSAEAFLEGMDGEFKRIPRHIRKLTLHGIQADSLPACLGSLSSLTELHVSSCHDIGSLPAGVGNLESLTSLYLSSNHSMVRLFETSEEGDTTQNLSLREVSVVDCPNLIITCDDFLANVTGEEQFLDDEGRECIRLLLELPEDWQ